LNGLKLQFHWVPCSLEITRVPDGAALVDPEEDPPPLEEGLPLPVEVEVEVEELGLELHAASAAASSAAAPVRIMRLIAMVLRFRQPGRLSWAEAGV
jgi:hypothetical protein